MTTPTIDPPRARRPWQLVAMLLAVASVLAAAAWSSALERRAALEDFAHEQASLARAVGIDFEQRLDVHEARTLRGEASKAMLDDTVLELLRGAHRLERPSDLMVMVARPGQEGFLTTDRRLIASARLRAAFEDGRTTVELPREEAPNFGLPRRVAVAGLARATDGDGRTWGVVVLATAERVRNRDRHEQWRLAVTVVVIAAIVASFGVLAQRRQKRELELERRVAVVGLEREREALLNRADKMAALAAIGTGVAHELGTPLGVIVGRVEQALARTSDPKATAALTIVLEQTARIQGIVRGCLALARGDAPELVSKPASAVAEAAASLVRHRFDQAGVNLVFAPRIALPAIACEPSLFEQVLVNVLLNACQATPRGGSVSLDVRLVASNVVFVVEDEGDGIDPTVASRATEPFFSTKHDEGGSGLGLTIAREIVSHHQGTLALSRREGGVGTRATVTVPARI